jgi:hypothetical protein
VVSLNARITLKLHAGMLIYKFPGCLYIITIFLDLIIVVAVMLGFTLITNVFNATKTLSRIYKTNDNKRKGEIK